MKKAQYTLGHKWLYFLVALFIIAFMFLYMRAMFQGYETDTVICTKETENSLMIAETLYSENCFVYSDENRVYPGTIDWTKFTQEVFENNCYKNMLSEVNLTIDGKNIGEPILDPVIVWKTIYLYKDGELTPSSMRIMLEAPQC